jgi:geranylgeranyl diphosphate synthase type 3
MEPYEYLVSTPGKDVRGTLIDAFQRWLKIPEDKLQSIKDIVTKLHNASLLIDDIQDNSDLRRGSPVAHKIFGEAATLNCCNYVYFQAMNEARKLDNARALNYFISEMLNLHRGQGLDIYWRDNFICPSFDQYHAMVMDKTGGVFRLAIHLMQSFSTDEANYMPLANQLGLFFQIRDDYVNLQLDEYMQNKSFCEDLTEGKFSYPIIHCILTLPKDRRILNILKQRSHDVELKKHAVRFMEEAGSFVFTLNTLKEIHSKVLKEITALGGNVVLETLVRRLGKDIFEPIQPKPEAPSSPGLEPPKKEGSGGGTFL